MMNKLQPLRSVCLMHSMRFLRAARACILGLCGVLAWGLLGAQDEASEPDLTVITAPPPWQPQSARWQMASWDDLPGWKDDALDQVWEAWLQSCSARQNPSALAQLCPELRRLSLADVDAQREWLQQRFQPWRIVPIAPDGGVGKGLLTGYYEPSVRARRVADETFKVPLFGPPLGVNLNKAWFSRQDIDSLDEAKAALAGRELLYLADPLEALMVQIQGSARVCVIEADGRENCVRLSYAGTNGHPYRSVGAWLLAQKALRDASWPGIAAWAQAHPERVQEMLWSNPRVVFFREERPDADSVPTGPRGAQGVALTPGRSIAVDPQTMPYGVPVWLVSPGPALNLRRLVMAQDTGGAITGPVRADYFVGMGRQAGEIAGRLKQPLSLWVLWPKPLRP